MTNNCFLKKSSHKSAIVCIQQSQDKEMQKLFAVTMGED